MRQSGVMREGSVASRGLVRLGGNRAVPGRGVSLVQRRCACGGSCPRCAGASGPQAKLRVGSSHDPLEREADAVAAAVMHGGITRSEAVGPRRPVAERVVHRRSGSGQPGFAAPASVERAITQSGNPLDAPSRDFFEARFGADFSAVRLHRDHTAAVANRQIGARAFTVGEHIALGEAHRDTSSTAGRTLLAHELTHVLQQRAPGIAARQVQRDGDEGTWVQDRDGSLYYATEREANTRRAALERAGEWREFRVVSFERGGTRYWRVEMRGRVAAQEQPPAEAAPQQPAPSEPAESEPAQPEAATICLTFDDGPVASGTEEVLNVLGTTVPAVFFLTGRNLASNAARQLALVERMIANGHQIGNHTFTHFPARRADYLSEYGDLSDPAKKAKFAENYARNRSHFEGLFSAAGGEFPGFTLARLPGDGRFIRIGGNLVYVRETESLGLVHVTWHFEFATNGAFGHVRHRDWQGVSGVAGTENRDPRNSEIILLHDVHWRGGNEARLRALVAYLRRRGFRFGRINSSGSCG
jgi:peptidoglycan/xylan/chitin deacetylase (PgdA/CDA1 family)